MKKKNSPLKNGFFLFQVFFSVPLTRPLTQPITQTLTQPITHSGTHLAQWHLVKYNNSPANTVQFSESGLKIDVNRSASPLFFDLQGTKKIKSLSSKGFAYALPNLGVFKEGIGQGDDFPLRIGLVQPSVKPLNWLKKLFAPTWIKELLAIEPNKGVEKVHFLTLAQKLPVGTKRTHPKSPLLYEEVIGQLPVSGPFEIQHSFEIPIKSFALWIQSDGDDTQSSFSIELRELNLELSE